MARTIPRMDLNATARALAAALLVARPALEPADDPVSVAIEQLSGGTAVVDDKAVCGVDHPQPCGAGPGQRVCKACALARAILVLQQHQAQTKPLDESPGPLVQNAQGLKVLAQAMTAADRVLEPLEDLLSKHLALWARLDATLAPLVERERYRDVMHRGPHAAFLATRYFAPY